MYSCIQECANITYLFADFCILSAQRELVSIESKIEVQTSVSISMHFTVEAVRAVEAFAVLLLDILTRILFLIER